MLLRDFHFHCCSVCVWVALCLILSFFLSVRLRMGVCICVLCGLPFANYQTDTRDVSISTCNSGNTVTASKCVER